MPKRHIEIPPQFAINGQVLKNSVKQLSRPGCTEIVTLSQARLRRMDVVAMDRADGTRILVVDHRVVPRPEDVQEIVYIKELDSLVHGETENLSSSWIVPVAVQPNRQTRQEAISVREKVLSSWASKFHFREERRDGDQIPQVGLRPPQIGALYGILAHWKVFLAPATVVMPTGTGKTETMLSLLAHERIARLLVIVPTNALRDQIGEKFVTFGLLKNLGVLDEDSLYPVVCFLQHKPKTVDEVDEVFLRSNVIVTTMSVAGQCDEAVQGRMAEICSHLFIDEAHHISARTWEAFRKQFINRPIVQFTATPFRNDGKHVDGRVVFNYPLRKAQAEGYFKPIRFKPVDELDTGEADIAIAEMAIKQLEDDLADGFSHLILARCSNISRAETVHAIYTAKVPACRPVMLHNKIQVSEAREALARMRDGETRVVVCVDMLGEGFDLPELKIAAIHDPHKSLAITLQFTGRFTRARPDLGDATMIANIADPGVGEALRDLYAEDADWNILLRDLSEGATTRQANRSEFLNSFQDIPEAVSLRNIFPKMSAVVYRTNVRRWRPDYAMSAMGSVEIHAGPTVNEQHKVLLFITRESEGVKWGDVRDIRNTEWHLYLVHWDQQQGLLFINSSNNDSLHEELAKAVGGSDVVLIRGEAVFRSLHNVNRLVLTNLGLSDLVNNHLRFIMHVGSDISDALPEALRLNKRKSNLFGRGYENGVPVSVGCSQKGRVWSMTTAADLAAWVDWCGAVGAKLRDDNISTAAVFKNVILPKTLTARPSLVPLLIDWPESFLQRPEDAIEIEIDGETVLYYDTELQIINFSAFGPIRFRVVTPNKSADYEVCFNANGVTYKSVSAFEAMIRIGRTRRPLGEWFHKDAPAIRFENGDYLEQDEYFELPRGADRQPFDRSRIESWDWVGIDLKKESQHTQKRPDSIQRRVLDVLLSGVADPQFQIVFDDDDAGEAADIVCIGVKDNKLIVHFYHCKFSLEERAGARVDDLYAVCGQAQRSVHWRVSVIELFKHLRRRDDSRRRKAINAGKPYVTRFERGDVKELQAIAKQAQRLIPEFKIFIVQPGLSKKAAVTNQLELLAATELYLMDTSSIQLGVIASP